MPQIGPISTSTFTNVAIRHKYASLAAPGDRLGEVSGLIDRDAFRPLLADRYTPRRSFRTMTLFS
ncbi:MAG: hypothetical protein ACXQTG_05455 [Methanoculleaceae archaeon]